MGSEKDGGPAFPVPIALGRGEGPMDNSSQWGLGGMSLRDYFASQALPGLMPYAFPKAIAEAAYRIADALLLERDRNISPSAAPCTELVAEPSDGAAQSPAGEMKQT